MPAHSHGLGRVEEASGVVGIPGAFASSANTASMATSWVKSSAGFSTPRTLKQQGHRAERCPQGGGQSPEAQGPWRSPTWLGRGRVSFRRGTESTCEVRTPEQGGGGAQSFACPARPHVQEGAGVPTQVQSVTEASLRRLQLETEEAALQD